MKKVIINSDDFGLDENTNRGIIELIEKRKISSTTILIKMGDDKFIKQAMRFAEENQETVSFGLHIDLEKFFEFDRHKKGGIDSNDIVENYREIYTSNRSEIQQDIINQFEEFKTYNVKISHIDGHHHIHLFPEILSEVIPVMKEYKVKKMRFIKDFYDNPVEQKRIYKDILANGICITDNFFNFASIPDDIEYVRFINDILKKLPQNSADGLEPVFLECYKKDDKKQKYILKDFFAVQNSTAYDQIREVLINVNYQYMVNEGITEVMIHAGKNNNNNFWDRWKYRQYDCFLKTNYFNKIHMINYNDL